MPPLGHRRRNNSTRFIPDRVCQGRRSTSHNIIFLAPFCVAFKWIVLRLTALQKRLQTKKKRIRISAHRKFIPLSCKASWCSALKPRAVNNKFWYAWQAVSFVCKQNTLFALGEMWNRVLSNRRTIELECLGNDSRIRWPSSAALWESRPLNWVMKFKPFYEDIYFEETAVCNLRS